MREVKAGARSPGQIKNELQAWNRELAQQAARICLGRQRYTALVNPFATANHAQLTDAAEALEFQWSLDSAAPAAARNHASARA